MRERWETGGTDGALEQLEHEGAPAHAPAAGVPRIVVVGAGFAGLEVARCLATAPVAVTVIDRANHHVFQPLLYQVATAELSPADVTAPIRSVFRHQQNAETLLAEVDGVDLARHTVLAREAVTGAERAVPYDYLVIATGAGQSYFGHDEWAQYAPGLKSITDATAIRRKVLLAFEEAENTSDEARRQALLTFVVIGGGPTGVELAGALADLAHRSITGEFRRIDPGDTRVVLVEAMDRLLQAFPPSLAARALRHLQRIGVEVRTHATVEQVDEQGVVIGGERLPARTVIWAAGVKASPAGEWLGAATDKNGRVIVQDDLTLRDHPDVFVIGDTANVVEREKPLPGVAPVAIQEGRFVAASIRHRMAREPVVSFHYVDKGNLATVGRWYALAEIGPLRFSGIFAWLVWAFVHIFSLIGFRNRLLVMLQWAYLFFTSRRGVRLISPNPTTAGPSIATTRAPAASDMASDVASDNCATSQDGAHVAGVAGVASADGSSPRTSPSAATTADTGIAADSAEPLAPARRQG